MSTHNINDSSSSRTSASDSYSEDTALNLNQAAGTPRSISDTAIDILDQEIPLPGYVTPPHGWGKSTYQADFSHPILAMPNPDGETTPTPFPPVWQKATNSFFQNLICENLIKKMKEANSEGANLSEEQINTSVKRIMQALIKGQFDSLSKEEKEIAQLATEKTQKEWSLPKSWSFGTQNVSDWTPTEPGVIPPVNVNLSIAEVQAENVELLCSSIESAGQKVMESMPPNDPKRIAVANLIKIISEAIRDLKEILQIIQMNDTSISSKLGEAKKDQIGERRTEIDKIQKKLHRIQKKMEKQKKISSIMKVLAPIVLAVVILVSAVCFFTIPGAQGPVLAAVIIVSTIMLGYTCADQQYDLTAKAVEAFNKMFETKELDSEWKRTLLKAVVVTVVIVAILAAIIASGGSAAAPIAAEATASSSGAAASAATQAAIQATLKEVIAQLFIQAGIMFVMASNAIPEGITQLLISTRAVDQDDQKTIMIIQMIISALMMIIMMATIGKLANSIGSTTTTATEEGASGAAALEKAKSPLIAAEASPGLEESSVKNADYLTNMVQRIKSAPSEARDLLIQAIQDWVSGIKQFLIPSGDLGKMLIQLEDIIRLGGLGVEIGGSMYIGLIGLQLVKDLQQLGELERAQEVTQILIKLFEKLLKSFQEGLNVKNEWINSLNNVLSLIFGSTSHALTKATQQFIA